MINNEDELFDYLRKTVPDLERRGEPNDVVDFYSDKKRSLFEVKARKRHYDDLVIEKAKYYAILERAKELNYTPYYVCSSPKGVFVFNLNEVTTPEWSDKMMPKTTDFSDRRHRKKRVGYLNICSSIKI